MNARRGNHERGVRGKTGAACVPGGCHATNSHNPDVAPPEAQWDTPSRRSNHPGGGVLGRRAFPLRPHSTDSESPTASKKTCGVSHASQYAGELQGSEGTSVKITSGSLLKRRGVLARAEADGQKVRRREAKQELGVRNDDTRNPRASATANHRFAATPRISQSPRGTLKGRKPVTRGRSQCGSVIAPVRPDQSSEGEVGS